MQPERFGRRRRGGLAVLIALAVVGVVGATTLGSTAHPAGHHRPRHPAQERTGAPLAHQPAPGRTTERLVRRLMIGRSVDGRPIQAIGLESANAAEPVLVVGCIDGNEPAGIAITRRLQTTSPPPRSALWIIPDLNPDGVAADTRTNAHLVDLNRNFPWHWRPLGPPGDPQYAGPRPLSEPESRAAKRLILRVRPQITIWFHQPQALVDLSGGNPRIERRFAALVGLPVTRLERYPGSAVSWGNAQLPGTTAFVVELPPGPLSRAAVARYSKAVLLLSNPRSPF